MHAPSGNAPVGVAAKSRKPWIQLPVFIRAPVNVTVQRHPERHPPWSTHCGAPAESLSTCTVFVANLEPCEDLSPLPAHERSGGPWLAAVLSPYGKHDVVPSHAEPQHDPWHRRPFNARHTLTSRTSSPARSAIRRQPSASPALYKYSTHVHHRCERHPDAVVSRHVAVVMAPRNDRRGTCLSAGHHLVHRCGLDDQVWQSRRG